MMRIVENLRIATKLAVTSALTILVVGTMLYFQVAGGADVRSATEKASRQQTIALDAAEAKASVRGMQMGLRDILLAANSAELQKGVDYFSGQMTAATKYQSEMARLSQSVENRARIDRLKVLLEGFRGGLDQLKAVRKQELDVEAGNAHHDSAEANAQMARLVQEVIRIRKDVTLPINLEIETLVDKITDFGKERAEAAEHEARSQVDAVERTSLIAGGLVALLLIAAWLFSVFTIARPMRALSASMEELANGNFAVVLPGLGRKDEVGDVAGAVEKFKVVSEKKARDEADARTKQDRIAAEQRKADMFKLADQFEGAVGEIIETVTSASTELEASASTLTVTAERSQELTTMVAAASEEASTNVQSVASATEELSSSVNEISRQVQESARMASEAVDQAKATNDRVGDLSKAAARIGDVVELINTIAGQTNLLALNATIERREQGKRAEGSRSWRPK